MIEFLSRKQGDNIETKFIAYREKDREFLNEHNIYDLKDLIGEDLYLTKNTLDYIFEHILEQQFGYEYDLEALLKIDWVNHLYTNIKRIQHNIDIDHSVDVNHISLWHHENNLVKVTIENDKEYIGRMHDFNEEDPAYPWLTLKLKDGTLEVIDYNKITKIVKTSVSKKIKKPHIAIKIMNATRGFRKL